MRASATVLSLLLVVPGLQAGPRVFVSCAKGNEIRTYRIDAAEEKLVAAGAVPADGPKMQWKHPRLPIIFVALGGDRIGTYSIESGEPVLKSAAPSAGAASYLCTDPAARFLFSASYRTGAVAVYPLSKAGKVGDALQVLEQPVKSHCILSDPSGSFFFVPHTSPVNRIDQFRFDPDGKKLVPNDPPHTACPENTGPRHIAVTMDGRFVYSSNEQGLSATAHRLDPQTGLLEAFQTLRTTEVAPSEVKMSCSDVELSPDERFLYVANRDGRTGRSSIACFAVNPVDGTLRFAARTPVGAVPRSFNITAGGRFMVVAAQAENTLTLHAVDGITGALEERHKVATGDGPGWVLTVTDL